MRKKLYGGIESIVAVIIILGIVAALLYTVVVPMAEEGEGLLDDTTGSLANQSMTMKPENN